jgi:ferritin-like metal-binding protein YciE
MENPIPRYIEDAIAAEKSFETQLQGFAKEATYGDARIAFTTHAEETRQQYEMLTARLKALGGSPSTIKSALAHMFNFAPKAAQIGHDAEERSTQDLMMAFAVENAEVAMYQSMMIAAEAVHDQETVDLAKRIQQQEQQTADKVWRMIGPAAAESWRKVSSTGSEKGKEVILRYLQDAEAAERNFEDALAGFSKMGDQQEVQSLLAMMSGKARTQYHRLESRISELGGTRSTGKSFLAHLLAFTPTSAQVGHDPSEKNAQHLMITYAAASAEMAMYESLAWAAQAAGDSKTEQLARQLQADEKEDHKLAWEHLDRSDRQATLKVMKA